jgi:hypothetical protein
VKKVAVDKNYLSGEADGVRDERTISRERRAAPEKCAEHHDGRAKRRCQEESLSPDKCAPAARDMNREQSGYNSDLILGRRR